MCFNGIFASNFARSLLAKSVFLKFFKADNDSFSNTHFASSVSLSTQNTFSLKNSPKTQDQSLLRLILGVFQHLFTFESLDLALESRISRVGFIFEMVGKNLFSCKIFCFS